MVVELLLDLTRSFLTAAVDTHVAHHLIHECILHTDVLGKKTRVMVTHNLDILAYAKTVIVMENGQIVQQGSYSELLQVQGIFRSLIEEFGNKKMEREVFKEGHDGVESAAMEKTTPANAIPINLIEQEERVKGSTSWQEYFRYASAVGGFAVILTHVANLTWKQVSRVGVTVWLGIWTGSTVTAFSQAQYIVSMMSPRYNPALN